RWIAPGRWSRASRGRGRWTTRTLESLSWDPCQRVGVGGTGQPHARRETHDLDVPGLGLDAVVARLEPQGADLGVFIGECARALAPHDEDRGGEPVRARPRGRPRP